MRHNHGYRKLGRTSSHRAALLKNLSIAIIKAGKIEYRTDKAGIISCSIGKASFDEEKLLDNYRTIVDTIIKAKPVAAKGQYIKSVTLSATMGPGVPLNVFKLGAVDKEQ